MTTGSWLAGYSGAPAPGRFQSRKNWTGADGRLWTDGLQHRGPPWHNYVMDHTLYQCAAGDGLIHGTDTIGSTTTSWTVPRTYLQFSAPSLATWTSNMELELLAKLAKAVKSHDFHIGVSLAEVDKVAEMVTGSLGKITRGVWELSRGNVPGALRAWGTTSKHINSKTSLRVKDVSGTFLELRYGWTPLLQDVFSAAKAFEEISNGPRGILFKVGKKIKWVTYVSPQGLIVEEHLNWVRRSYHYEQSEELSALRSMGLYDPLSVLWERLPWSFVIDWFLPIGTYLQELGVIPFLKGRFLRTTSSKQAYYDLWKTDPNASTPVRTTRVTSVPGYRREVYTMNRSVLSSLPVPFPKVHVAGAIQGRRVGNAIALAHQMFDRAIGIRTPTRLRHQSKFDKSDFSWPYATNFDR